MTTSKLLRIASRSAAFLATALTLLSGSMLPAHAAHAAVAAQGGADVVQPSVKEPGKTHRVPGTCTPWRCR